MGLLSSIYDLYMVVKMLHLSWGSIGKQQQEYTSQNQVEFFAWPKLILWDIRKEAAEASNHYDQLGQLKPRVLAAHMLWALLISGLD